MQHSAGDSVIGSRSLQGNLCQMNLRTPAQIHHTWDTTEREWVPSTMKPHPTLRVRATVSESDYALRGLPAPRSHQANVFEAIADTGAMVVTLGEWEV